MARKDDLKRADDAIEASLAQADNVVTMRDVDGRKARAELRRILRRADVILAKRLAGLDFSGEMRFTEAQAIAYRAQIRKVLDSMPRKLGDVATAVGKAGARKGRDSTIELLATLERDFNGITIPLPLRAAMRASHVLRGRNAALVTRVATSFDRYGERMGNQFAEIMQDGLVSGATVDQMTAALVNHGGPRGVVSMAAQEVAEGVVRRIREEVIPEGLFVRHRYWAERIARTETAHAYSGAKLDTLYALQAEGDDPKKKILATFDNRTAPDSIAVHGQVRDLDKPFRDGAGREYLHPPGRPNDRETIVPWYDDWPDTDATRPRPEAEREAATREAMPRVESEP